MYDYFILKSRIVDGTGRDPYTANVGIKDGIDSSEQIHIRCSTPSMQQDW